MGDEAAQTAQRSCGCPILGDAQDQTGWGPGQPELVGGSQPMARGWCCVVFKVPSNLSHSDSWTWG